MTINWGGILNAGLEPGTLLISATAYDFSCFASFIRLRLANHLVQMISVSGLMSPARSFRNPPYFSSTSNITPGALPSLMRVWMIFESTQ